MRTFHGAAGRGLGSRMSDHERDAERDHEPAGRCNTRVPHCAVADQRQHCVRGDLLGGEPVHQHARRRRRSCVRLGARDTVHRVDDRPVRIDRRVLRTVVLPVPQPGRTKCPFRPLDRGGAAERSLLSDLAAALRLRAPGGRGRVRCAVPAADRDRPPLQPRAVTAYQRAGDSCGAVRASHARLAEARPVRLVRADRGLRPDDLSTSRHRCPAGCDARIGLCPLVPRARMRRRNPPAWPPRDVRS